MAIEYKSYLQQLAEAGRRDSELTSDEQSAVEHVLQHLEAHEESERELLGSYRYAARLGPDAGVRFLMGLILEDEERHERLMSAMARDVKSSLFWLEEQPPLPDMENKPGERDRLMLQTQRFLQVERENAEQLKALKREVSRLRSGLLQLIVDGMEADTRKHIGILKYIQKQLEGR